MSDKPAASQPEAQHNYIRQIIQRDLAEPALSRQVVTRFPPEPNGFLHIGHAKSICVNFGLAEEFGGQCHLRFDDTNPAREEQRYIDAIQEDVRWLGFQWAGPVRYASDYFHQLYQWALHLIRNGDAYVCELSAEQASEYRGWATKPGKDSPYRDRSVADNLARFEQMKNGELEDGAAVLRAKIDMASPNMNLRDPILYRIRHQHHHQTGDLWCIYPSYDFAHGQGDAIEGISHSICTLEFQDHRPLYDWLLDHLPVPARPRQYEFGRLNLNYTVTSKRKLKQLVDDAIVAGWDDPRMPTIAGLRRRGYTAQSIRNFCDGLAVAKTDGTVDMAQLEFAIRDDLNNNAPRAMCVLDPVPVQLSNFADIAADAVMPLVLDNHPNRPGMGSRSVPLTADIVIDRADFSEDSSLSRKKFKRLVLGDYVRLRGAFVIRADQVIHSADGSVEKIIASIVPDTLGCNPPDDIRPRGVIHWVSASEGVAAEVRLYERLFSAEQPDKTEDGFLAAVNPDSLRVVSAMLEPAAAACAPESHFQFEREGYFVSDRHDHAGDHPVFNKTIGLKEGF
ncbi:MAG TPA: glutamine--tRNA ligase/YqeY domain fusion protein [Pseudomonadales bacterium]